MIIVNEKSTLGSKGFASLVFDEIKPVLDKQLNADDRQEIANDVEFFGELDLSELDKKVFNAVFQTIQILKLPNQDWQQALLKVFKQDPRYTATT
ncbi:hypothetical protein [Moraxella equi]|uniref:Uncharacterized protein n=1 Tax=Moraxella equi TaxID=60442 RepID=A0A378QRX9_9GAMM|nr:hypothetical protein [Moraxella equi]OPH36004.1 hypothetical protein B5J93_09985 [Moraxella equi]STZ03637.1 Uncharacterised protein [Moraxella equi]